VTDSTHERLEPEAAEGPEGKAARRRFGMRLLRRLVIYHVILAALLVLAAVLFPAFVAQLPIGGIQALARGGDLTVGTLENAAGGGDFEIVDSLIQASSQLDRLGYARQLVLVIVGVLLLMLPVSWVHKGIHRTSVHDHSLDETTLILPGVVAAIVIVVQHSLPLAFSLAGIIAGVQFRRALQDTFDALFILVAIGAGIAAGIAALEITAVLTVFFTYTTLFVYFYGDGLQSDFDEQKKLMKRQRKEADAERAADADED
jgi:hypothetical protein